MTAIGTLSPNAVYERATPQQKQEINEKVAAVYKTVASGFIASYASALLSAQTGLTMKLISVLAAHPTISAITLIATSVAMIYKIVTSENATMQKGFFAGFTVLQGIILSPLVLINAPVFTTATLMTAGLTGGLGFAATTLNLDLQKYSRVLSIALGAIGIASLGSVYFGGMVGYAAHQINLYGGLALFSAYVIHDVEKAREDAILSSTETDRTFNLMKHTIEIYLDAVNLLVRVFELLDKRKENA